LGAEMVEAVIKTGHLEVSSSARKTSVDRLPNIE
jgi:hypothetical protein